MAVISTFDQWKKDVFFSAAEEVQESADTMESVYRVWIRGCIDGCEAEFLDELRRELHTTLGTAKWQLEEFERAVSLAHGNYLSDDNTILRHREFIAAIRNKISHIEKAINDSLHKEGKQPLRWVQLDEQERDDFENFLSMAPPKLQESNDKYVDPASVRGFKKTVTISKDAHVVEVAAKEDFGIRGEVKFFQEENLESSSDIGAWKIVIPDEEDSGKKLVETRPEVPNSASIDCGFFRNLESTSRLNCFRNSFRKVKSRDNIHSRQGISTYLDMKGMTLLNKGLNGFSKRSRSCFNCFKESPNGYSLQQVRRFGGLHRHFQVSQSNKRSLRVTLLLVVTIFFIGEWEKKKLRHHYFREVFLVRGRMQNVPSDTCIWDFSSDFYQYHWINEDVITCKVIRRDWEINAAILLFNMNMHKCNQVYSDVELIAMARYLKYLYVRYIFTCIFSYIKAYRTQRYYKLDKRGSHSRKTLPSTSPTSDEIIEKLLIGLAMTVLLASVVVW